MPCACTSPTSDWVPPRVPDPRGNCRQSLTGSTLGASGEQRQPVVDDLQILSLQIDVAPRHIQRTVAKNSLQPEHISPVANVVDRKCMPQSVEAKPDALSRAETIAKEFEIPQEISLGRFAPRTGRKY